MSRRVSRGFDCARLSALLAAAGMTRSDIARLADISAHTLSAWVNRGVTPDIERLTRVCAVLGAKVTDVVIVDDADCMPSDLRIRRGLTQVQLGAAAGLSTTVVSGFERAETRWSPRKAAKLAPVLGVSVEQLHEAWQRARARPAGAPA